MKIVTLESLREGNRLLVVPVGGDRPREKVSRRCASCGAVMPADVGTWIVAADDRGVMLLCSRACDEQLETEDVDGLHGSR